MFSYQKILRNVENAPEFVTKDEFCTICGVCPHYATKVLKNGLIPYVKRRREEQGAKRRYLLHYYDIATTDIIKFAKLYADISECNEKEEEIIKQYYTKRYEKIPDKLSIKEISELSTVKTIVNRYGSERCSKIHTDNTIPNLFFSLKDTTKDATLKIITQKDYYIDKLEKAMGAEMKYDKDFPCFAGKTDGDKPEYDFYAYMFDLHSVAQCIDYCKTAVPKVNFCCFDYQKEYIESITGTDDNLKSRIETLTITEEGGREIVYG